MGALTDHVQNVLLDVSSLVESAGPVIASAASVLGNEDVFVIEKATELTCLDGGYHPVPMESQRPGRQ